MGGDLTQVLRRPVELAGVKRTLRGHRRMSASDPKRTLATIPDPFQRAGAGWYDALF